MATRALFIEVGADGDVITALLPLTRNMIILSAFLRRAFGDLVGDFCHIAVVAGELNAVESHTIIAAVALFSSSTFVPSGSVTV